MNKEAMLEIADVIEKARPENFSMGSFFGERLTLSDFGNDYYSEGTYYDLLQLGYPEDYFVNKTKTSFALEDFNKIIEDNTIKISCNTTACIAGWVVINQWLKDDNSFYDREHIETRSVAQVVTIATEILGLSIEEAYNLFYCQYGSVWNVLAETYGFDFDTDIPETWNLDNKKVADVLRKIANGEIELTDEWIEANDKYN